VALAILIPGVAFAAVHLIANDDVAASMPAGALARRHPPTFTTVRDEHVNGGCRSLNSDGTEWECYIGQAAVDQQIISQGFSVRSRRHPASAEPSNLLGIPQGEVVFSEQCSICVTSGTSSCGGARARFSRHSVSASALRS
jgi:hypothetical protein